MKRRAGDAPEGEAAAQPRKRTRRLRPNVDALADDDDGRVPYIPAPAPAAAPPKDPGAAAFVFPADFVGKKPTADAPPSGAEEAVDEQSRLRLNQRRDQMRSQWNAFLDRDASYVFPAAFVKNQPPAAPKNEQAQKFEDLQQAIAARKARQEPTALEDGKGKGGSSCGVSPEAPSPPKEPVQEAGLGSPVEDGMMRTPPEPAKEPAPEDDAMHTPPEAVEASGVTGVEPVVVPPLDIAKVPAEEGPEAHEVQESAGEVDEVHQESAEVDDVHQRLAARLERIRQPLTASELHAAIAKLDAEDAALAEQIRLADARRRVVASQRMQLLDAAAAQEGAATLAPPTPAASPSIASRFASFCSGFLSPR